MVDCLYIAKDFKENIFYIRVTSDPQKRFKNLKEIDNSFEMDFRSERIHSFQEKHRRGEIRKFIEKCIGKYKCTIVKKLPDKSEVTLHFYKLTDYKLNQFLQSIKFEYPDLE